MRFGVRSRTWVLFCLWAAAALSCGAQAPAPASTLAGALASVASRAAIAFVGQVVSIEHAGSVVIISLRVEQPVIGVAGSLYELREWGGLWPPGQVRYTVGERALIFLHAAGAAGVATPVGGGEGVLPVLVQGLGSTSLVDVRRLAAAVLRPVGTSLADEETGAITLTDAVRIVESARNTAAVAGVDLTSIEPVRRPLPGSGVRRSTALREPMQVSSSGLSGVVQASGAQRGVHHAE